MEKRLPKRFNARDPDNAKSRRFGTNCSECSKQRSRFKHEDTKRHRMALRNPDYEPKYRNEAYRSSYQSLAVEREADKERFMRWGAGRSAPFGRCVFTPKEDSSSEDEVEEQGNALD